MSHPSEIDLALFAGGDLGFFERLRVSRHVKRCANCGEEVEALRNGSEQLRIGPEELPDDLKLPELNWTRLSREMTGNIRVGLAAGECVGPVPETPRRSLGWHAAAVMTAAFAVTLGAMWWKLPGLQRKDIVNILRSGSANPAPVAGPVTLEGSGASIDLNANGATMSILSPRTGNVAVSVTQNSARAEFVDSDTDQVTINKIYYAQ